MKCTICGSEEHFRAKCPRAQSQGGQSGGSSGPAVGFGGFIGSLPVSGAPPTAAPMQPPAPPWAETTLNETPSEAFHVAWTLENSDTGNHSCFASFNTMSNMAEEAEAPSLPYASVATDPFLAADPWGAAAQRSVEVRANMPPLTPQSFGDAWRSYLRPNAEQWQDYSQRAPRPPSPRSHPAPPTTAPTAVPKTAGVAPPRVSEDDELSAHSWTAESQGRESRPAAGESQRAEPGPFHMRTHGSPISLQQLERLLHGQI